MCECRDCDNFKAKKREPVVGDRVFHSSMGEGILVSDCATHNPETGNSFTGQNCLIFRENAELACRNMFFTMKEYLTVID